MWVPKIRELFLFNCICGFFIDAVVLYSLRRDIRSMDVIVRRFVDLFVTALVFNTVINVFLLLCLIVRLCTYCIFMYLLYVYIFIVCLCIP
jgi:hypothetical protein